MNLSKLARTILGEPILIMGCIEPTPLLERYKLLATPLGTLFLHHFLRSDEDRETHDHPWSYVTLILAGGYVEQVPIEADRREILHPSPGPARMVIVRRTERFHRRPGQLLFRPAKWTHRVELEPGRDAWTLIWTSRKTRVWGFFTDHGWIPNWQYHSTAGCADGVPARMES